MTKLHTGDVMRDFTFRTPFETGRTLGETVRRVPGRTALVFLRYLGCTSCQFEIRQYALAIKKLIKPIIPNVAAYFESKGQVW